MKRRFVLCSNALVITVILLLLSSCSNSVNISESATDNSITDKPTSSVINESTAFTTDDASSESETEEKAFHPIGDPTKAAGEIDGPVAVTDTSFWQPLGKITLNCAITSEPKPNISKNGTVVIDFNNIAGYDIVTDGKIYDEIKSSFERESKYRNFFEPGATLNMMIGHDELNELSIDEFNKKYLINDNYYEISSGSLGFTTLEQAYEAGKMLYSDFSKQVFDSMQKYISEQNGKLCISKDIAFTEGGGNIDYNFGYSAMLAYYTDNSNKKIAVIFCIPGSEISDDTTHETYYNPIIEYRTYAFEDGIWKRSDNWHHRSYIACNYESSAGLNWDKISVNV